MHAEPQVRDRCRSMMLEMLHAKTRRSLRRREHLSVGIAFHKMLSILIGRDGCAQILSSASRYCHHEVSSGPHDIVRPPRSLISTGDGETILWSTAGVYA